MMQKIDLAFAENSDIPLILQKMNDVFEDSQYFDIKRDYKYWDWKYKENPFGNSILIVAKNENGAIVGFRSFWAWNLFCRGKTVKGYQPVDTFVIPEYQKNGIFRRMNIFAIEESIKNGVQVVFNFPNCNSINGDINLGWNFVSKMKWLIKPMNFYSTLSLVFDKSTKGKPCKLPEKYSMTMDKISRISLNKVFTGKLQTDYSREFLVWRYLKHPFFSYGIIEDLNIILIFSIVFAGSCKQLFVVDVLKKRSKNGSVKGLISKLAKELKIDIVFIMFSCNELLKSDNWFGFVHLKRKNLVALPIDYSLEDKILNIENWSIFGGLHDSL